MSPSAYMGVQKGQESRCLEFGLFLGRNELLVATAAESRGEQGELKEENGLSTYNP